MKNAYIIKKISSILGFFFIEYEFLIFSFNSMQVFNFFNKNQPNSYIFVNIEKKKKITLLPSRFELYH